MMIFEYGFVVTAIGLAVTVCWLIDLSVSNRRLKEDLCNMEAILRQTRRDREIIGNVLLEEAEMRAEFERGCG
jgi:hypothetical protein